MRRATYSVLSSLALSASLLSAPVYAAGYPTNDCVGAKLSAAARTCGKLLKAWGKWDAKQDDAKLAATRLDTVEGLEGSFLKADAKAAGRDVDCEDTTLAGSAAGAILDDGTADIGGLVNTGLDLANKDHRKCGSSVLKAAAVLCKKLLKAESKYVKSLPKTPNGAKRDETIAKAVAKFEAAFTKATTGGCPTATDAAALGAAVDGLAQDIVTNSIVSPNVPTAWTRVDPPSAVPYLGQTLSPKCALGTPWSFFVKRGTVNKLLVYFQGGGACWDDLTCGVPVCDQDVNDGDNPANTTTGLADLNNPANPFRDWNAVFVSYCTCDVHWGDQAYDHGTLTIEHRGAVNSQVAEKWAREHFLAPNEVFVTGSSAGAYGAISGSVFLQERVYKAARFNTLGDAGNGVITQDFVINYISRWGIEKYLPTWIEALDKPITELSIDQLWVGAAAEYPDAKFAQYTSAYDGGNGSQTQFYNVMLNPGNLAVGVQWWLASCEWNQKMRDLAQLTAAGAPNYRSYVGSGSRHTIFGSDKVYTDTVGGVIPLVDFIAQMRGDDPAWANQQCAPCNLMPGTCSAASMNPGASCQDDVDCPSGECEGEDPRPSPLVAPFGLGGVVTCP